ncbi:putative TPR repeat methyltransferase [Breoghania corrubedonensis]|uniref:Putative TPR repeat methyltransferase n=1 Tax=Breoghania corrubedonensis TaxID=665038 RepID=A0A2T5VEL3_9HYPH|nr:methyltransferase [Breoghania corrubedonensis]PTW62191.1 putative TPR repeat methyltransferase [Breoghania corrubedonensis]
MDDFEEEAGFDEEALAEAYNRGLQLERDGDVPAAVAAYREALKIDPADHCGITIRLAAMGRGEAPEKMPDAYVATLFDQHADDFEEILVDQLGYCVPLLLHDALRAHAPGPHPRALDLGCGTGLSGLALSDICDAMTGVDLSERMVEIAFDRGVYADLYTGEAVEFLQEFEEEDDSRPSWDLIVATDVFPYLGAIEAIVAAAADRLNAGGVFAFSTETLDAASFAGKPYILGDSRRYAQSGGYVRSTLEAHGFTVLAMDDITVRAEKGVPVPGHLVIARKG